MTSIPTCTASARMLTPRNMAARPSTPNLISLALAMDRWAEPKGPFLTPDERDLDFLAREWSMALCVDQFNYQGEIIVVNRKQIEHKIIKSNY